MSAPHPLIQVLEEARRLIAQPENDFSWSSWEDAAHALQEIGQLLEEFRRGDFSRRGDLEVVFAPTGPMQELSLSSGWSQEFLQLAGRYDEAVAVP